MPEESKIEVSKEQLDDLLKQNQELLEQNRTLIANATKDESKEDTLNLEEIKNRLVRVLFVDEKAVQSFANRGTDARPTYVYEKPNPNNASERILFVDVIFNQETEPVSVPYNDLLREGTREECSVLETKVTEWDEVQGKVAKKIVKDYNTEETGVLVPIKVLGERREYVVKLPDGSNMTIDEKYINM